MVVVMIVGSSACARDRSRISETFELNILVFA